MESPRLDNRVVRVTLLQKDEAGDVSPVVLYKKKRKKKRKTTLVFRPLEEVAVTLTNAQKAFANTLSRELDRSSRRKRDGWMRDCGKAVYKATRQAGNQFRIDRLY